MYFQRVLAERNRNANNYIIHVHPTPTMHMHLNADMCAAAYDCGLMSSAVLMR
jgi:hypothetical protein